MKMLMGIAFNFARVHVRAFWSVAGLCHTCTRGHVDTRCAPHVQVFVETMGCDPACLMNCDPKEDFGGPDSAHHGHADPNLAHARALCDRMCVAKDGAPVDGGDPPSFGAAADGDAVCVCLSLLMLK